MTIRRLFLLVILGACAASVPDVESACPMAYGRLISGQSLALGYTGGVGLSVTQPYANRMPAGGMLNQLTGTFSPWQPLVEGTVETVASALTSGLSWKNGRQYYIADNGLISSAYAARAKGTAQYAIGLAQISSAKAFANASGQKYRHVAVDILDGESDALAGSTTFGADMLQGCTDLNADIKAITKQTEPVLCWHSQLGSEQAYSLANSQLAIQQLNAALLSPSILRIAGPRYQRPYADGAHPTNIGYRAEGEQRAKAEWTEASTGVPWLPLHINGVTRSGSVVTWTVYNPIPGACVAFDTTTVSDPGTAKGFEWFDDTATATATSSAITGCNVGTTQLSGTPTGTGKRFRYAFSVISSTRPRGNVRNNDPTLSLSGGTQYDWLMKADLSSP